MPKKKTQLDRFADLTWIDIEEWAGRKIVSRGKNYQRQGLVSDLAVTDDGNLIAWVNGTWRYATRVFIDQDGLPDSICTCPYAIDCKHGVAVVIEYLKRVEDNRRVPKVKQDDDRLKLLEDEAWEDEPDDELVNLVNTTTRDRQKEIAGFLKGKTKAQLIDLIHELAEQYPEMASYLADRGQLISGNTKSLVTRLRREIRETVNQHGWQNYWRNEGFTPDYSGICTKLETLLKAGHADEVLRLGLELLTSGTRQVEESHDEGETAMEVVACMPVIVEALDQSSLDAADKLNWALDAVLEDQFDVCEAFSEYLHRQHPKPAWHTLVDRLLTRLDGLKGKSGVDSFSRNYERNQLSNWVIHALEQAGREKEVLALCESEARKTGSYDRLVKRLMEARRYKDAEHWIQKGVAATKAKWPGIASGLRDKLLDIRKRQKDWPAVTAIRVEAFMRHPSRQAFTECRQAAGKAKAWPAVRKYLLCYLENGELPWKQKGWPIPPSGLDRPKADQRKRFPLVDQLIAIAILEKKPDQVLRWYDQRPKDRFGGYGVDQDEIATAVQIHAPDRAVDIWKNKAEGLISQVKPSAYQEAARYLRKAASIVTRKKKKEAWDQYLSALRQQHFRKRRLMEILDGLEGKPIVKKRH
ncbi:SWIM zinc finger family protein [Desulfosarcina sp.]|uniref:SWIM zinc finger family protein n=1 Tax=Desulfosarcina sp. TaxID=2027861 RepID=UPI0029BCAFD4|nr:SWIM zinc finger family protein [Desulfosarcina sp.]MDX2451299.1 SWIM zinc finger family protein [Desulfosarcina sp.]MDX2489122.1 SWIM zinc finger family protein [Desulfosarcina sp.]